LIVEVIRDILSKVELNDVNKYIISEKI